MRGLIGVRSSLLVCVLASAAACVLSAPASASAAQPVWSIEEIAYPTVFVPESSATPTGGSYPSYQVIATNVGDERSGSVFTVSATLPAGISPAPGMTIEAHYGPDSSKVPVPCSTLGQVVSCTGEPTDSETGIPPGVPPGERVELRIPVALSAAVANPAIAEATVSGGGALLPRSTSVETVLSSTPAAFGFLSGEVGLGETGSNADGTPTTQAGAHPYQLALTLGFTSEPNNPSQAAPLATGGSLRDASAVLPTGLVVSPGSAPQCRESELESKAAGCPDNTQVGIARTNVGVNGAATSIAPVYNMVPPPGSPAELGFEVAGLAVYVHIQGRLRSDGKYELAADASDVTAKVGVFGVQTTLWGDPTAASHDAQRGKCLYAFHDPLAVCPVERVNNAFVTMPSACSGPLHTTASIDSWLHPEIQVSEAVESTDLDGNPVGVEGCSALPFEPSLTLKPDNSEGDSPTGLLANLHVPQNEEYETEAEEPSLSSSTLADARVTLPPGVSVNPSAANGRGACTESQVGFDPSTGNYSASPPACPDNAKVGSVEVITPLLKDETEAGPVPHPLPGSIYLAQPYENPFGTLLALYLVVDDPTTGVVVKLAGRVDADPVTGQLTTTFRENPQLPFEDFRLSFFGGPRAALKTPATCGSYVSMTEMTSWSGGAPVLGSEPFPVDRGAGSAPCASSPQQLPNSPSFQAGTVSPQAGSYSPFVLRLERPDGSQTLSGLNVTLPEGLTGRLTGIPYCSDAAIAAAAARSGREEQASPSCPAASEVGRVTVGAGAGPMPYYAGGRAYLAGPYKGAPLSLAIVTPAVAGPFDLGDVVVRAALNLGLYSAQITVNSDPLPTILKGIPLDVRSVAVQMDRADFTLNPTSCEPMTVAGEALTTAGQAAALSNHFQAAGCRKLKFKPTLRISLKGKTKRTGHPALKAVVTYPKKGRFANIASAQVGLPHSEFLDNDNLGNVCTQPQLASRTCPKKSIYGRVKAWTPLLDKPLTGPVYLGVGFGHRLPDVVAELNGQIRVLLHGKVDTDADGGLRNTFETVPDAPVSKFVLEMQGGKQKGLLENSENICRRVNKAVVAFTAQTGEVARSRVPIATSCKGSSKKPKSSKKHHR